MKRYFMIEKQIARYFVLYSICLSNHPSLYATEMMNPMLDSIILTNHKKG